MVSRVLQLRDGKEHQGGGQVYCVCRSRTSACRFLIPSCLRFAGCFLWRIKRLAVSLQNCGIGGSRQRGKKGEKRGERAKGREVEEGGGGKEERRKGGVRNGRWGRGGEGRGREG